MRIALLLYVAWTLATLLLEGWPRTLLRPEAVGARVAYALVANVLIGTVAAGLTLRRLVRDLPVTPVAAGFGPSRRTLLAVPLGAAAGALLYVLQGAPSGNPVVLANAYAQTLNVTIAEVLVCWSVVATAWYGASGGPGRRWAPVAAGLVAAIAFGVYHVAHSPPFNTLPMMALLTMVGFATSVFFLVSRDIYGTIVFHNFLALVGVVGALAAAGRLAPYETVQAPLLVLGLASLAAVILTHVFVIGRGPRGSTAVR